ncbi:hypothetical protein B0J11DRAFT_577309 [Dendryphion nanum]|uniref:Uncharacterized protein n=1 Tax=Dendryphion nanum TaxID=256645 RepID=A0A9P9E7A3_9PLEO|nr:hypothetical protein B0J11DRAFT_577309 [Dendryphion nanum]
MATPPRESWVEKLKNHCATYQLEQPRFQEYSDPRGIRTAWSSGVVVQGREYRATLWRDYRYLEQCHEEAAEVALRALLQNLQNSPTQQQYGQRYGYSQ